MYIRNIDSFKRYLVHISLIAEMTTLLKALAGSEIVNRSKHFVVASFRAQFSESINPLQGILPSYYRRNWLHSKITILATAK